MEHDQLMMLSFDRPTFPRVALSFEHDQKHKLSYGWYQTDNHTASITTSQVSADNVQTALNDASLRERCTWGSLLFSLEKNILVQRLKHRDWLLSINLHDPKKHVNHALFGSKVSATSNSKSNQKAYAAWLMHQL